MKNLIVFDLDDTLICTKRRHYEVYSRFLDKSHIEKMGFHDYLMLRKRGQTNSEIIRNIEPGLESSFVTFWKDFIESPEFLQMDTEIVNSSLLQQLKNVREADFQILSLRTNANTAFDQFKRFSFAHLFENVSFLVHESGGNPKVKALSQMKSMYNLLFFVGDTAADREAATLNSIPFFGVLTGLKDLHADHVSQDINELIKDYINHEF